MSEKPVRSALDKAFSLLRAFRPEDNRTGVGVSELARRADLSKSTAHRLLASLAKNEAVVKTGDLYRLGPLLSTLSTEPDTNRNDLVTETLTPFMAALFEHTHSTVHLAYLDGRHVRYANKLFSVRGVRTPIRIGGTFPSHATGVGKAMLAYDSARAEEVLQAGLKQLTPRTITNPERLEQELARIRQLGVAHDNEEMMTGLTCIAAPIIGQNNQPVAALSVSGATSSFKPERHVDALLKVTRAAGRLVRGEQANRR